MLNILAILSTFCVGYYVVLTSTTGYSKTATAFWMFFASLFGILFFLGKIFEVRDIHPPKPFRIFIWACFVTGVIVFSYIEGMVIYHSNSAPSPGAEYMIVLGAQVNGHNPSDSLQRRLDRAAEYAKENPNIQVIVTGGRTGGQKYTEARVMNDYLVKKGINESRIYMEGKAKDTNQNIDYSKKIVGEGNNPKIIIVTNGYHIYRSILLCRKAGLTHVEGLGVSTPMGMHLSSYGREAAALAKEYIMGNVDFFK